MPERKIIFKVNVRVVQTDKVFKKYQVYDICGITSKNYTVQYDAELKYKIPKDLEGTAYYAFVYDGQEKYFRESILRQENATLDTPPP